jgi:Flp pilus assembly protein TadG
MTPLRHHRRSSSERGQALVEFALTVPLSLLLVLGVVEIGYALLDQHVITSLSREGANLISRDTTLDDAATALSNLNTRPVDLGGTGSKVIFSVITKVATLTATNYDHVVLYQRHIYGDSSVPGTSALSTPGGTIGSGPHYYTVNPQTDPNLRISNLPANLDVTRGAFMYVTEIFSTHTTLTPLDNFGVTVPSQLYSIAYF